MALIEKALHAFFMSYACVMKYLYSIFLICRVRQFVQEWTKNTDKHTAILDDLFKVQTMNDKLQVVIMEERTHCQHLVGLNDQLAVRMYFNMTTVFPFHIYAYQIQ